MRRSIPTPPKPHLLSNGIKNACDVWKCWSHKAGDRVVTLYSELEFDHAMYLEASNHVLAWREQPLKVERARENGRGYIVDYWAYLESDDEEYGEIKESDRLVEVDGREPMPKDWAPVKAHIEDLGAIPRVVTEMDLAPHAFLIGNWRRAVPHIARAYFRNDADTRRRIRELVHQRPPITLGEIEGHLSHVDPVDVWAQSMRLHQEGDIAAKMAEEPLDRCLKFRPRVN